MLEPHYDASRRVTREEMKLMDTVTIESVGVPGAALMEMAGRATAEAVFETWERLDLPRGEEADPAKGHVLVLAGSGNNGGDALVAARYLLSWGIPFRTYLVGRNPEQIADKDAGANLKVLRKLGVEVAELKLAHHLRRAEADFAGARVVIDGLLGTGMSAMAGKVRPPADATIERVNALEGVPVIAVDIPSGLDCNTGEIAGVAIRATRTVTMALPKVGFFEREGPACVGELQVVDIGIPHRVLEHREGTYFYREESGKTVSGNPADTADG